MERFAKTNNKQLQKIRTLIAQETEGDSYTSHKYCYDSFAAVPHKVYDDNVRISLRRYGETDRSLQTSKSLRRKAKNIKEYAPPLFRYFLDGSRRTYKIDDIAYGSRLYPIIAGQVGVGCCERLEEGEFKIKTFVRNLLIALPACADKDGRSRNFFTQLKEKINQAPNLKRHNIQFDEVRYYRDKKLVDGEKYESLGIAKIQDAMMEAEKRVVAQLAHQDELNEENYLLKDGSLEYREIGSQVDLSIIKSNYKRVVGVSKSFNPERCVDHRNRSNAVKIAQLPLFHRTPAYMFESYRTGGIRFAIWYLRIRDASRTVSPFDGIIKVEKILISEQEQEYGLDSDEVDVISANLINERNPVSYGRDSRWANHLYPVFLTESFIKSKYLSDQYFLNIF